MDPKLRPKSEALYRDCTVEGEISFQIIEVFLIWSINKFANTVLFL